MDGPLPALPPKKGRQVRAGSWLGSVDDVGPHCLAALAGGSLRRGGPAVAVHSRRRRDYQREEAALARLAPFQDQPASLALGQLAADVEAQTGARDRAQARLVEADELVEDGLLLARRDADAVVLDFDAWRFGCDHP